MIVFNYVYSEVGEAIKGVLKMQGISGLWKGYIPTLYRDVPFSALYWCIYETFKRQFNPNQSPSLATSFIGGAVAGSVSNSKSSIMNTN